MPTTQRACVPTPTPTDPLRLGRRILPDAVRHWQRPRRPRRPRLRRNERCQAYAGARGLCSRVWRALATAAAGGSKVRRAAAQQVPGRRTLSDTDNCCCYSHGRRQQCPYLYADLSQRVEDAHVDAAARPAPPPSSPMMKVQPLEAHGLRRGRGSGGGRSTRKKSRRH